jgi:type VI secretion system secreted protein VgrG
MLGLVATVATSRAQDVGKTRSGRSVIVDTGDAVTITNGAASIKLEKDGTITLKGTNLVVEGGAKLGGCAPTTPSKNASEVF